MRSLKPRSPRTERKRKWLSFVHVATLYSLTPGRLPGGSAEPAPATKARSTAKATAMTANDTTPKPLLTNDAIYNAAIDAAEDQNVPGSDALAYRFGYRRGAVARIPASKWPASEWILRLRDLFIEKPKPVQLAFPFTTVKLCQDCNTAPAYRGHGRCGTCFRIHIRSYDRRRKAAIS